MANLLAGKPDLVVKRYVLGQDGQPEERGAWKSGALMGERHVDEDGKSVTVFTNLMGEKVLERQVISAGVFADTYYVYDDLGQLRFVLPPMCDLGAGKQQALEAYAYEYRYDGRSRVVYKRLPGCAPVRYWYDNRGRVVFTQDGELLKRGLCRFTFYDPHGRLAMQGTCTDTPHNVHSGVVTLSSVDGLFHSGYVGGVHLASPKVERINYYDDYNFLDGPSFKEYTNVNLMRKKNAQNATGHPTGSVTLTTGGEWLYGVTYYTAKGLPCDTRQSCLGGKVLLSRTEYSFTDKPLRTVWEVRHDGRTDSVVYANSYSPVNDALAIQLVACNGGAPQFVSRLEYDDLGRLVRKTLPGNSGSVEYGHNVRGWLTTLSGPGYAETLSYDGLYNGNIASVSHSYQNGGVRDTFRYTFAYDNLNRMVSAGNDHYGESVDYDRNGNVVALHRYGKRNNGSYGLTDDLQLHYVGNHIRGITDRQGGLVYEGGFDFKPKTVDRHRPYEYNTVGALAHDPDRNVTVSYSVLGTPAMIAYGNGNTTEYIYDADGTKLKTTWKTRAANALCSMVAAEETGAEAETDDGILSIQASVPSACVENSREQVGPFIFTDGKLEWVLFDGGFCLLSGQYTAYCYYVCDHLGSVREVVSDAWNVQRNGYYAYGGPYGDWNTNADVQPLKFLGKEWDHQHGLDLYDFGARLYDPAVGRWTTMDPLCEKYYSVSPYAYCHDNPVNRIDPDGRDWYQNNYTSYYTWYDGNVERKGFRHIGGKGSVLGMFEHIIDNVLCGVEGLGLESLYSNGFTFDIAPKDKGGLIGSNKRGWDFFDEFVCGTGPEFSVLLEDHPYTQAIMNDEFAIESQNVVRSKRSNGLYLNVGRSEFFPWQASLLSPMQFIGTYRYDGYSSGGYVYNVVTDIKSVKSLGYHIPFLSNHRRRQGKKMGNTYQFYIWKSAK